MRVFDLMRSKSALTRLDVELLVSYVLGISREKLFTSYDRILSRKEGERISELSKRRLSGEPLAYLVGKKAFYGRDFFVDRRVLIPRPETEMLVEKVLSFDLPKCPSIIDVGTGSGNIAVTLASVFPDSSIVAVDTSSEALAVCRKNVIFHRVADKILLKESDLLSELSEEYFDVIVANLPYIGEEVDRYVSSSTEKYEPHVALFGGGDGLLLYRRLFDQVQTMANKPKYLLGECGFTQGDKLLFELSSRFPRAKSFIEADAAGLDRIFVTSF